MYFLGAITGASGANYNDRTGVSGIGAFSIPQTTKSLYICYGSSGATGLTFLFGNATGATSFINSVNGAPVPAVGTIGGPFRIVPGPNVQVGIYNPNGGFVSVRIYSALTS